MTADALSESPVRVLGFVHMETMDLAALIASLRPGESLKLRHGELLRAVPILEVQDDAWRKGIDA